MINFWLLFALCLLCQLIAVFVRQLSLSLFFAFIHSIIISLILIAMGHSWLGVVVIWLVSGLSYFSLFLTTLLIGPQQQINTKRKITFSSFIFILILASLTYISISIAPNSLGPLDLSSSTLAVQISPLLTSDFSLVIIVLALMALSTLISAFLLIRGDDHSLQN